jgi:hypothetical protein
MKVAFDECVPPRVARAILAMQEEGASGVDIVSARTYSVPNAESDVPWIERFAAEGGQAIVSGDVRMRGNLHEQKALRDAGMVTIFMARAWGQLDVHAKSALLIKWWPFILNTLATAKPGQCFEVPCQWHGDQLNEVTPPETARKPGRKPRDANAALTARSRANTGAGR